MKRSARMSNVQDMMTATEREHARQLAVAERRDTEAQQKLDELLRYQSEYMLRHQRAGATGMLSATLRDYQAFYARLGEAVRQQQQVAIKFRAERDFAHRRWQEALLRVKAVGSVVERWQGEERRATENREQSDSDERVLQRRAAIASDFNGVE